MCVALGNNKKIFLIGKKFTLNKLILTRLNSKEFKLALHGKMTSGKLNATESTKPILIISEVTLGSKLINMLPENKKFTY